MVIVVVEVHCIRGVSIIRLAIILTASVIRKYQKKFHWLNQKIRLLYSKNRNDFCGPDHHSVLFVKIIVVEVQHLDCGSIG